MHFILIFNILVLLYLYRQLQIWHYFLAAPSFVVTVPMLHFQVFFIDLQLFMHCAAASTASAAPAASIASTAPAASASSKLPFCFWRMLHAACSLQLSALQCRRYSGMDCWSERTASRAVCLISSFKTLKYALLVLSI
jgi:hypothetical protein